jgi:hypothetical protein
MESTLTHVVGHQRLYVILSFDGWQDLARTGKHRARKAFDHFYGHRVGQLVSAQVAERTGQQADEFCYCFSHEEAARAALKFHTKKCVLCTVLAPASALVRFNDRLFLALANATANGWPLSGDDNLNDDMWSDAMTLDSRAFLPCLTRNMITKAVVYNRTTRSKP